MSINERKVRRQPFLRLLLVALLGVSVMIGVLAPPIVYYSSILEARNHVISSATEMLGVFADEAVYPLLVKSSEDALILARRITRFPDIYCVRIIAADGTRLASACQPEPQSHATETLSTQVSAGASANLKDTQERHEIIGEIILTVSLARAYKTSSATAIDAAIPIVVLTVMMSVVMVRVSMRMLRPLADIAGFLRDTEAQGDPPIIAPRAPVEVHVIRDAVQTMRKRIADDTERLLEYAGGLQAMVDQRTRELNDTLAQVLASSRAKTLFIANVSHELRTPLQAIILHTRLMENAQTPLNGVDNLRIINQAASHLLDLIEQLLDVSRIQAKETVKLNYTCFCLDAFLEEAVATIAPTLSGNNRLCVQEHTESSVGSPLPEIECDRTRLLQVVFNLLRNADKFTVLGTLSLSIEPDVQPGVIRIRVADNGIGIPPEDLDSIFEPFFQGEPPKGMVDQGVGIGLWLTRNIVDAMGGSIKVRSTPGHGTTFDVLIPQSDPRTQEPAKPHRAKLPAQQPSAAVVPESPLRVLLAEDEDIIRLPLVIFMKEAGFQVDECADGAQALSLFKTKAMTYDVIVLDQRMPHTTGTEILIMVRTELHLETPVILLTGNENKQIERDCERYNATLFYKPIQPDVIIAHIRAAAKGTEKLA